ncbi:hypothetical protein FPV67DRAFT_1467878 [Lyophyllum atratum]|nr:hypothetical protein FPV67DRAFT_1467878 [Lyophyllum atratum]
MSTLLVRQIADPDATDPHVINSYRATLEADGSLNTSQIDFVAPDDRLMINPNDTAPHPPHEFITDPSDPLSTTRRIISPRTIQLHSRHVDGELTLTLISKVSLPLPPLEFGIWLREVLGIGHADFCKWERRRDADDWAEVMHKIATFPRTLYHWLVGPAPSDSVVRVRQVRQNEGKPCALETVRSWDVHLEPDLSLDTSKLDAVMPDETYWVFPSDSGDDGLVCHGFIYPRQESPIIPARRLGCFYHRVEGVECDVITIIGDADKKAMWRRKNGMKDESED